MAKVHPFRAYLAEATLVADMAALPYDVFTRDEATAEISRHPLSFLRIDKTAALLDGVGEYNEVVYSTARELLDADMAAGRYVYCDEERFYVYQMSWTESIDGSDVQRLRTGLLADVDSDDYRLGVMRRHENTRVEKLADRVAHIRALNAQTGPVLLAHRSSPDISELLFRLTQVTGPLYDFVAEDGVGHAIWAVDPAENETVRQSYAALETLYIADGHHRAQAAFDVGDRGILAVLFSSDELDIKPYNRCVKDLNGLEASAFLEQLSACFTVSKVDADIAPEPDRRGLFAMHLQNQWYQLVFDEQQRPADLTAALDVSVLQDRVLAPLLGIDNPKTSDRIAYVGGTLGLAGLLQRARNYGTHDQAIAFALYPTSMDEFFAVADNSELMPPKSTWFAPKPRSGMLLKPLQ